MTKGCAGSGKTSVSVEKYSYLYESGKTDLVYLTYNEKLSIRIQNDLNTIFGEEIKDVHVRTVANFFQEFIEDECKESLSGKIIVNFNGYNGEKTTLYFSYGVGTWEPNLKTYHKINSSFILNNNMIVKHLRDTFKTDLEMILRGNR